MDLNASARYASNGFGQLDNLDTDSNVFGMSAYRPERLTLHYDKWSGEEIMRIGFEDYHPVKQVVFLSVNDAIMWWQKRPNIKGV